MLRWADPPDDVRVDNPAFDRRQVLLARHSKCDNAIAQGWIGDREFHTARIGFAEAGVAHRDGDRVRRSWPGIDLCGAMIIVTTSLWLGKK
jgi:hypothetical protein